MQSRSPGNCRGTDVSHWQGDIDWNLVKSDGISFAFIKATEGVDYQDPKFSQNIKGAKEAGILVGAYHFCTPSTIEDALNEAGHFINVVNANGGFDLLDLPPVIDIEKNQGLGKREISQIVSAWVQKVKVEAIVQPVIYSYSYFISEFLDEGLGSAPLWLAHYGDQLPPGCSGWKHWLFLQYTDRGRVSGISGNVDLNEYNGDTGRLVLLSRRRVV
ncbi:MAG TPA: hypothetical protein DEF36_14920 [Desulfotomaculum sp.]|nr:hypothetical protein [Desulfotomaculum sp.]